MTVSCASASTTIPTASTSAVGAMAPIPSSTVRTVAASAPETNVRLPAAAASPAGAMDGGTSRVSGWRTEGWYAYSSARASGTAKTAWRPSRRANGKRSPGFGS
ncbi:hypothetical protein [Streptomyces hydrogenans]|uniref:hypothetical protein n=1 Tax=Streptomyces hydrogenans TaxID=1873719 RepID=UPI0033C3FA41